MNLLDFLKAGHFPAEHPAMVYRGVTLSRGELFDRVDRVAVHLLHRGLRPGDGLALAVQHPAVYLVFLLAAARVGAVACVFNPESDGFAKDGWMYPLGFRALVQDHAAIDSVFAERFDHVLNARDLLMNEPVLLSPDLQSHLSADHSARPWFLPQSSGTTGTPKHAVISQASTCAAADLLSQQFHLHDRVAQLTEMSMYWSVWNICRFLRSGAVFVRVSSNTLPGDLLAALRETCANKLVLSTDAAAKLLSYMEDFGVSPLGNHRLDQVTVGGASVSSALAKGLHAFLGAQIRVGYGSTEAGPTADLCGAESQTDGCLNLYPGVQAQVLDEADRPLADGLQGRLRLRSAALFNGYLQEGQWPKVAPQWFYPGDLAVLQGSLLRLMGRVDHVLNLGGLKIDPERLEQDFRAHPAVLDAAVLALPLGRKQVQVLVALLVLKSEDQLADVQATFERTHGKAMHPQHYALTHELPRNLAGKLQRQKLAQMVRLECS